MNNIIFEVGDIVEVVGPVSFMAYSGIFKIGKRLDPWIGVTHLKNRVPTAGQYYFRYNYLYIVPSEELTFKLIKYLDKQPSLM